jgi:hypothetical protein
MMRIIILQLVASTACDRRPLLESLLSATACAICSSSQLFGQLLQQLVMSAAMIISVTFPIFLAPRHVLSARPKIVFQPQFPILLAVLVLMVKRGGHAIYPENVIVKINPLQPSM